MVRIHPDPPRAAGGIAQLGERLVCNQEVNGSIPFVSTSFPHRKAMTAGWCLKGRC